METDLEFVRKTREMYESDTPFHPDMERLLRLAERAEKAESRLRDSCLEGRGDQEFPPCARAIESEARAAAAEKDAQRYRWLCAGRMEFGVQDKARELCWWRDSLGMEQEEINAVIDAAIKGSAT